MDIYDATLKAIKLPYGSVGYGKWWVWQGMANGGCLAPLALVVTGFETVAQCQWHHTPPPASWPYWGATAIAGMSCRPPVGNEDGYTDGLGLRRADR